MKKVLFYALMLVLGMGVLSSCSKEGNGGSIIGTWELVSIDGDPQEGSSYTLYFQFQENRNGISVEIYHDAHEIYYKELTWFLSGDTLIIDGEESFLVTELTKDSLTLALDTEATFKRVSDSVIDQYR